MTSVYYTYVDIIQYQFLSLFTFSFWSGNRLPNQLHPIEILKNSVVICVRNVFARTDIGVRKELIDHGLDANVYWESIRIGTQGFFIVQMQDLEALD